MFATKGAPTKSCKVAVDILNDDCGLISVSANIFEDVEQFLPVGLEVECNIMAASECNQLLWLNCRLV